MLLVVFQQQGDAHQLTAEEAETPVNESVFVTTISLSLCCINAKCLRYHRLFPLTRSVEASFTAASQLEMLPAGDGSA